LSNCFNNEIKVIRNPLPDDFMSDTNVVRNHADVFRLVYFGRISKEKGLLSFCKNYLFCVDLNLEVHFFGEGDSEIIKDINLFFKKNKNVSVFFHGYKKREELLSLLTDFDAFFLPSEWVENAPLSIIEAASFKLPVIVSDLGGMREMAQQTKEYFLLNEKKSGVNEYLNDLISTPRKNEVLNKNSFTFDYFKSQLLNMYSDL